MAELPTFRENKLYSTNYSPDPDRIHPVTTTKKGRFRQKIIGAIGLIFIAALFASVIYRSYLVRALLSHEYDKIPHDELVSCSRPSENFGTSSTSIDIASVTNGNVVARHPWRTAAIDGTVSWFSLIVTYATGIYGIMCTAHILEYMELLAVTGIQVSLTRFVIWWIFFAVLNWASAGLLLYGIQSGWSSASYCFKTLGP
ncbi:hypothetical protein V1525DRAFT_404753 [Lipomyces kononenkoae]|uniref:Uncharacterized protein n=1 Tax=Lipomyces kononenkoae TaxID=34357 RepID=A0ACC3SZU6_LIPKO